MYTLNLVINLAQVGGFVKHKQSKSLFKIPAIPLTTFFSCKRLFSFEKICFGGIDL